MLISIETNVTCDFPGEGGSGSTHGRNQLLYVKHCHAEYTYIGFAQA